MITEFCTTDFDLLLKITLTKKLINEVQDFSGYLKLHKVV